MRRDLAALDAAEFDLVVIGGGMFGAAAALDATQRGLKVALVERGDFCGATSAHSFKMIHGGIRYLQHADVPRIRQSARARASFLRIAPHLAHPLPIVIPTYGAGMRSKPVLQAGMAVYDALTWDRNHGIRDPARRIPRGWSLGRDEVVKRYPGLPRAGLSGAGVFCDGQMYNPARLVLAFVRSAADRGAVCANYVEATGLLGDDKRVRGVRCVDRLNGGGIDVRARLVLNAAGPYASALIAGATGHGLEPPTPFSRDAYFIVARPLIDSDHALTVPAASHDPDALLSRGGRHLFMVPWRGATLVGVWHKVYPGHPDDYGIEDVELGRWIAEINQAYGGLDLTLDDVALGSAGLVPFGENDGGSENLKFAHRSRMVDHARERGLEGCITLIGVRYTTGTADAVEVINLAERKLGRVPTPSMLETVPVDGGDVASFADLVDEIAAAVPAFNRATATALAHNQGSAWRRVAELVGKRPDLSRTLPSSTVTCAEIVLAVRDEMAATLPDIVFRRTDLCTIGKVTPTALTLAAEIAGAEAGWSPSRMGEEVTEVEERLHVGRTGRAFLAGAAAPGLATAA